MDAEKLKEILDKHKLWLNGDEDGERANLVNENLEGAKLSEAILVMADLRGANLENANLKYSDLRDAYLIGTNLRVANLRGANIRCAHLIGANLFGADLENANLKDANLESANLRCANLRNADISRANLEGANLRMADLSYANLSRSKIIATNLSGVIIRGANFEGASLTKAIDIPFIPIACPSEGSFIGWKKVGKYIVKLQIPEDAKRSSATTNKCRCDKAKVIEIQNIDGTRSGLKKIVNENYSTTVYKVGKYVYPDSFDEDRWNECSNGIHFFINREEAVNY